VCLLEDVARAETLYPLLCRYAADTCFFYGTFGSTMFGPTQRIAGDVARLLKKDDEARCWYEETIALGERMRAPMLIGLARRRLEALGVAGASSPLPTSEPTSPRKTDARRDGAIDSIELRRDGEMWTVTSSNGIVVNLKDSKGLAYLNHLVTHPRQEIHVTQLAELTDISSDAGVVLDGRAKTEYKERLDALRDRLVEAERFGDATRAEATRAEIDAIADQLAGAVGLGGRDRKLGSHVERVRINVQRRIRDTIQRIDEHDPALGRYLASTIKTGILCVFTKI
jgi:non-specific serine/threonine protein kinase